MLIKFIFGLVTIIFCAVAPVQAAPALYFDEGSETVVDHRHSVGLFINTQGSTITAMQTIINLPTAVLGYESVAMADYPSPEYPVGTKPNCTHSLLPPEWGLPNKSSPYADNENTKLYISCGFTNPGYTTQGSTGDKIATLVFFADTPGSASISFDGSNTKFYYIGNQVASGSLTNYTISVLSAIEATPAPGEIPEKATDSLSASDLQFVEVGSGTGAGSSGSVAPSTSTPSDLEVVEEDNTIPSPPENLPQRSLPESLLERLRRMNNTDASSTTGEVLSAQSLRELLIPGTSDADRRVVLINLISLLIFLIVLGIFIWRFIVIKRQEKARKAHLSELLTSELAAIESKMGGVDSNSELGKELNETLEQIKTSLKH